MEKRAFIAVVLSLLVLIFYQEWMSRYFPTPEPPPSSNQTTETKSAPESPTPAADTASAPEPAASAAPAAPRGQRASDVIVDTEAYRAIFTTSGARLKSFEFKRYRSTVDEKSPPFEIVPAVPGVPLPLGVRWQNGRTAADDTEIVYAVDRTDLTLNGDSKGTLTFKGRAPDGSTITKSFTFSGGSYPIDLAVSVSPAA